MNLKPKHKFSKTHGDLITLCISCDKVISDEPSQRLYCSHCKSEKKEELIKVISQYNSQYVGQRQFETIIKKAKALVIE